MKQTSDKFEIVDVKFISFVKYDKDGNEIREELRIPLPPSISHKIETVYPKIEGDNNNA